MQHEIIISPGMSGSAEIGQLVEVLITHWPTARMPAQGRVVRVLGDYMAPGMEIDVAIRNYDIPHEWPEAVLTEAGRFKEEVAEKDKLRRVDLRDLPFVTIDGADARDFDDAVYCEQSRVPGQGGWQLYVAIADVSHYVQVGSALDAEAEKRGNSVYFPERVIPMLPEALSNGLCSLNPDVDRLAMVCQIEVARSGRILDYKFYEAVIRSHGRLTYDEVSAILERPGSREGKEASKRRKALVPHLQQLYDLYQALARQRKRRGAIDFETRETYIVFGDDRKIAEILPTERNDAHKLIEECMLCANVAMADFLQDHEMDGLYRVHDGPPAEKLEKLRGFLTELGLTLNRGKGDPTPKDYLLLLESVRERPDFQLIQTVMLRSLSQAVYSPDNNGHFGLNYEAYTHFTSPIRRYADLLNHRAVRSVIRSRKETEHVQRVGASAMPKARIYPYDLPSLEQIGVEVSLTERRADEATRDVVTWLKCEFMLDRVGDTFAGVVTSVTGFGLFVELTDIYVEGLVHVTALPGDYYQFDPLHHRLTGERSGRSYRLGDTVEVIVARVDLDERKIDFKMSQAGANTDKHPVSAPKKGQQAKGGKKTAGGKAKSAAGAKSDSSAKSPDAAVKSKPKAKSRKRKVVSKSTKAGHYE